MTETDLLDGFYRDDPRAFTEIFRRFYPKLCDYSYYLVHNWDDAKEIATQALHYLFKKDNKKTFINIRLMGAFLIVVTKNKSRSLRDDRERKQKFFRIYCGRQEFEPDYQELFIDEDQRELRKRAIRYLQGLPRQSKAVMTKLYLEGKKARETAEELGISLSNLSSVREYALRIIREKNHKK